MLQIYHLSIPHGLRLDFISMCWRPYWLCTEHLSWCFSVKTVCYITFIVPPLSTICNEIWIFVIFQYFCDFPIFSIFSALDMVLNSVALFFVVELDDLLVKTADYERIQAYIQDYNHVAKTAVGSVATPSFLKSPRVQKCKICYKKCGMGCRMCWRGISCCCRCLYGTPYKMLQYFTIILCFILPFFIFVCYDDNVKCD